jgi:hypothetical protein
VDGIELTKFLEGLTYEVGTTLGNYLLALQWAEPATERDPAAIVSLNRTIRRPGALVVEDDADLRELNSRSWSSTDCRRTPHRTASKG